MLRQGANQCRPLAFDQETCFDLLDRSADDGFIVQIKKARWMRRSKVSHSYSVLRNLRYISIVQRLSFCQKETVDRINRIQYKPAPSDYQLIFPSSQSCVFTGDGSGKWERRGGTSLESSSRVPKHTLLQMVLPQLIGVFTIIPLKFELRIQHVIIMQC